MIDLRHYSRSTDEIYAAIKDVHDPLEIGVDLRNESTVDRDGWRDTSYADACREQYGHPPTVTRFTFTIAMDQFSIWFNDGSVASCYEIGWVWEWPAYKQTLEIEIKSIDDYNLAQLAAEIIARNYCLEQAERFLKLGRSFKVSIKPPSTISLLCNPDKS